VIVHRDQHLAIADKPAGLPSVPGRTQALQDCLWRRVQAELPDARVVHRLDMATSGLMLFALSAAMQRALSIAFAERRVHKQYVAVVAGCVVADEGEIDLPLAADWPNRPRQVVDHQRGKPSRTRYRVIERSAQSTRLALEPLTGRSHQLRVHLAAIGHPILGDALYAPYEVQSASTRLLLHASALAFVHPHDGTRVEVTSPVPF
jgi:tRNA pseudouridine32 synthase / 23S rRNA pseudouridine746 synthase